MDQTVAQDGPWELQAVKDRQAGHKPPSKAELDRRYVAEQVAHARVYAGIYAAKGDSARALARQQEEVDVVREARNLGRTLPTEADIQAAVEALQERRKKAQVEEDAERDAK